MRLMAAGLLLLMPLAAAAGDLWITAEQRAQQLLDAGHPDEAARLFADPRRRAYAESKAGRYDEAARLLAPLRDPDSDYNRGNALARSGELVAALSAYDAALAQAPDDRDARHNRDLVARVLASRAHDSGQGGASRSGRNGADQRSQSSQGQSNGASSPSSQDARNGQSSGSQAGEAPSTGGATPEQEAEQARQDAALAAELRRRSEQGGHPRQSQGGSPAGTRAGALGGGTGRAGGTEADNDLVWPPPKSEQALALDQWLRRIPEDPGGLLRRKFLIEHMERQEVAEQP